MKFHCFTQLNTYIHPPPPYCSINLFASVPQDEVVCVGEESGVVSGHCVQSVAQLWSLDGQQRVRGLAYLHAHLVVATSNGVVQVYSALDPTSQPRLAASIQAGCRITSLALFDYKRYFLSDEFRNV